MAKTVGYFALAFGNVGCIPNGTPTPFAVSTRREVREAIEGMFYDDPAGARRAFRNLGIRNLWSHAKRHGFSSIFRELNVNGSNEILNFMGLTEAEYDAAVEAEEF